MTPRHDEYEDKLLDVMQYVKMRLDDKGVRLKLRSKDDIKRSILALDADRRHGGSSRISEGFLQRILDTERAEKLVGRTIGRSGVVRTLRGESTVTVVETGELEKVRALRGRGKDVFRSGSGFVVKDVYKSGSGRVRVVFRDVGTGKFARAPER